MTLPREVQYAMDAGDAVYGLYSSGFIGHRHWQALRAHLLSQDAEIERLTGRAVPLVEWQVMESRLAAADALLDLLRTGSDGKKYAFVESRDGSMVDISAYLQGAGDEA